MNVNMSLLMFAMTEDFVVACADCRGTVFATGKTIETYNKLIKTNNDVIIGCSNNSRDCYEIIKDYASLSLDSGIQFQLTPKNVRDDYARVIHMVSIRFRMLRPGSECSVVVCGWNGDHFEATTYCESEKSYDLPMGIHGVSAPQRFIMGSDYVCDHLAFWKERTGLYGEDNMRQFKNAMRDVLDEGVKFDTSINNVARFEVVRRKG